MITSPSNVRADVIRRALCSPLEWIHFLPRRKGRCKTRRVRGVIALQDPDFWEPVTDLDYAAGAATTHLCRELSRFGREQLNRTT